MEATKSSRSIFKRLATLVVAALAGLHALPEAKAQPRTDPALVEYVTSITQIQEQLPFARSYTLQIKSPFNLLPGVLPISFDVETNGKPAGVTEAEALSYISFSPSTINFTAPNQTVAVQVTMTVPAGATPGAYGYKITADGWPVDPLVGLVNLGTFINATVTAPPSHTTAPQVDISTPVDGSTVTVSAGSFPVSLPMAFRATSTGATPGAITAVAAELDGATVVLGSITGLSTTTVDGAGTLIITAPGQHTVTARATNAGGTATDTNTFRVSVTAAPPTVAINTPTANATFTYRTGSPALVVPFTFTATSSFGGVRTLTAKVDGAPVTFSPAGLGSLTATGSVSLTYSTAGTHTLEVTTTDDNGTATAASNFTVNVVAPVPVVTIAQPLNGAVITLPVGVTSTTVAFSFGTTSNNGFFVDSVSAQLDTNSVAIATTTGLGTASATSTGTLLNVTAGTHTLTATGISAGVTDTDSVTFTVKASTVAVPPSVAIVTPPVGSTYTRVSGAAALTIPLSFTGTSNTTGAVITKLTASLNGSAVSVATQNLNTKVATGTATLSVTNAGTYTISVAAVDANGTATATRTFSVVVVQPRSICGETFFDVDFDGRSDCGEFGLSGITVKLYNAANQVVATDVTDSCGRYSFSNLGPGAYTVVATAFNGLSATTLNERDVTIAGSNICVPGIGFGLNFTALKTMTAGGNSHGYWKGNIDKAIAGKTSGTQVSKNTLLCYTDKIGDFALSPYNCVSLKTMASTLGYTGSSAGSLLSKQLIASELNYQAGAYIGGNRTLTFLFLWWGEYVLANQGNYSSTYTLWAKDWMDAYNNSHGGLVAGPAAR